MKINITKEYKFEAAHYLPKYNGKCRHLHGHSYRVVVEVEGPLNTDGPCEGMVVDYGSIDVVVKPVIELHDHTLLNDFMECPTAEKIGIGLFEDIERGMMKHADFESVTLVSVTVMETAKTTASVRR